MQDFQSNGYAQLTIEKQIHETELSDVFRVKSPEVLEPLCLKVSKSKDRNSMSNIEFVREAKALSAFNSEHIVKVLEYGLNQDLNYMLLEFVEGKNLEDICNESKIEMSDFFEIAIQIVKGLDHIHQAGYLHRDLKDQNIMILGGEGDYRVKIIDLGFALEVDEGGSKDSRFAGTIEYSAPEQLGLIKNPIDERSDLYSIGVIFYKMLTSKLPLSASRGMQSLIEETPRGIQEQREDCPAILDRIILKLLNKVPEERYQLASSLLSDLLQVQQLVRQGDLNSDLELDRGSKTIVKIGKTFVGRKRELKSLVDSFNACKTSGFQAVFVGGRAGIGKSSLIRELETRIAVAGARFAYGKSYEFSKALPAYSLGEAFEDVYGRLNRLPQQLKEPIFNKLRKEVGGLAGELIRLAPSFYEVFSSEEIPEVQYLGYEKDRQRFISLVMKVIETISHQSAPLVILLDDLQWADGLVIDLIESLVFNPPSKTHVLLVGSYRSEEVSSTDRLGQIISRYRENCKDKCIEVEPLEYEEVHEVIAQSLGVEIDKVATDLIDITYDRTKGNPLFVSEFLKALLSESIITKNEDNLNFDKKHPGLSSLGGSIVDLVIKRVETLEDVEVDIIARAALIGLDFKFSDLKDLCEIDGVSLVSIIDKAVDQQILKKRNSTNFAFFHDRIHEACQELLQEDERVKFHLDYLDFLERSEVTKNKIFEAAEHAIRAGDHKRTVYYCIQAGLSAFERHANFESLEYFGHAISSNRIVESSVENQRRMFIGRADALVSLGNYEEARQSLDEVLKLYRDDLVKSVEINSKIAECLQREGKYKEAQELLATGLRQLGWSIDFEKPKRKELLDRFFIRVHSLMKIFFKPSERKLERLRVVADSLKKLWMVNVIIDIKPLLHISYRTLRVSQWLGVSEHLAVAYQYLSFSLMNLEVPDAKKAFGYAHQSIDVGRQAGADEIVAGSLVRLAAYNSWTGNFKDSKKYSDSAREALTAIGNLWDLGNAVIFSYFSNRALGRLREALSDAYTLRQLGERTGSNGMIASGSCKIAEALLLLGDIKAYEESIEFSLEFTQKHNLKFDLFQVLKTKGLGHLLQKQYLDSTLCFSDAVKIVESGASFFKAYLSYPYLGLMESYLVNGNAWAGLDEGSEKQYFDFLDQCEGREQHYSDLGYVYKIRGLLSLKDGDIPQAKVYFEQAIDEYNRQSRVIEVALLQDQLGRIEEDKVESYSLRSNAVISLERIECKWLAKQIDSELVSEGQKSVLTSSNTSNEYSEKAIKALLQVGEAITQSFELKPLSRSLLDRSIEIFQSERGLIFFFDEEKDEFEFFIGRTNKKEDINEAKNYSSTFLKNLRSSKEALIVTGTEEGALLGAFSAVANNLVSIIGTPILIENRLVGAIYLDNSVEKKAYGPSDSNLLWVLAQQIGIFFKLRDTAEMEIKTRELEKDLELTGAVQNLILPEERTFKLDSVLVEVHYEPASYSGGDWWWLEKLDDGRILFLNGDVTGHGPGPAMVTAMASGAFKTFINSAKKSSSSVDNLLEEFNKIFLELCKGQYLMTIQIIEYRPNSEVATIWFAGSPPVWILRQGSGVIELLLSGSPLGQREFKFSRVEHKIEPGDQLLFFSDGYYEAPTIKGNQYGIRTARRFINKMCKEETDTTKYFEKTIEEYKRVTEGCPPDDDTTIALVSFGS